MVLGSRLRPIQNPAGNWKYEKVGKGRPPKDASFHVRFTDATGKRRWSQPFKSVEDANKNSDGVKIASEAAAKGLTVTEFKDTLNAGKTTIKDAVEQFLSLKKRKRPKTLLIHHDAESPPSHTYRRGALRWGPCDRGRARFLYGNFGSGSFEKKTIQTRMGVVFSLSQGSRERDWRRVRLETGQRCQARKAEASRIFGCRDQKLFEAMTEEEWERYAFFLSTGCREQEVMYATWDDIDFVGKTYKVEGKDDVDFAPEEP